jgi:hypothetical protein
VLGCDDSFSGIAAGADFLRIIGEAAKKARVAISMIDTNKCENWLIWKGVYKPTTAKNRRAHAGLLPTTVRTASMIVAIDTMMHTMPLYSDGERNSTTTVSVTVASSVMKRVKIHFLGSCRVGTEKVIG